MNDSNQPVDVLLVEDNSNDMELALRALKKEQLDGSIFVVRDGSEALDFLFAEGAFAHRTAQKPPRLILLDLKLPKVSGIDVLRQIKSDPRTKTIPVVMFTSSQQERDVQECYGLGVNSYVVKPVDYQHFAQTIVDTDRYWTQINQALA